MSRDRDSDFDISAAFDDAQSNLPMAPASEDTDDGIFINWPGFDYDEDEARQPFDDDENEDSDLTDGALTSEQELFSEEDKPAA